MESVTRELGLALGATKVSFLIADLSGRALVRLAHLQLRNADGVEISTPLEQDERRSLEESATVLPFDGGPQERTVRSQEVQVVAPDPPFGLRRGRVLAGAGPGDRARRGDRCPGADAAAPPRGASREEIAGSRTCWRSW